MKKMVATFFGRVFGLFVFCVAFLPLLCIDIWRGLKTGVRLGRIDFENDLAAQKEFIQMELFKQSSRQFIKPEEVLSNGHQRN